MISHNLREDTKAQVGSLDLLKAFFFEIIQLPIV